MTTFTFQFTTSESQTIQSALIKATSEEKAIEKFFKKNRKEMTSIAKIYFSSAKIDGKKFTTQSAVDSYLKNKEYSNKF